MNRVTKTEARRSSRRGDGHRTNSVKARRSYYASLIKILRDRHSNVVRLPLGAELSRQLRGYGVGREHSTSAHYSRRCAVRGATHGSDLGHGASTGVIGSLEALSKSQTRSANRPPLDACFGALNLSKSRKTANFYNSLTNFAFLHIQALRSQTRLMAENIN